MARQTNLFNTNHSNQSQLNFVEGSVLRTFFSNPTDLYKVLLVKISKTDLDWNHAKIVVTGNFGNLDSDKNYRFLGNIFHHPKYGDQFKASGYENDTPTSRRGLIKYLSGSHFPGIGKHVAKQVVDQLGTDLIEAVLSNPKVLTSLHLSAKQTKSLLKGIEANNGVEQIIIGLNSYGFGSNLAAKIYQKYKGRTLAVLHDHPYWMVEDIHGVSFRKADLLAKQIGFSTNDPGRLRAGILTALRKLSVKSGDTYTYSDDLFRQAHELLDRRQDPVDVDQMQRQLIKLAEDNKIVVERDGRIYPERLYNAEWRIAEDLHRVSKAKPRKKDQFTKAQIKREIKKVERKLKINYDRSQTKALLMSIEQPLFLLSGGPGTGKTTIIRGMIDVFAGLNHFSLKLGDYKEKPYPVLLAAPTGRAAKRMNEATHLPASTIHRLLGLNSYNDYGKFSPGESDNKLTGKILVIDEMSMVDTRLFYLLMSAVPNGMKVVLVGDKDQLPSVGPGQVFHDLLASGVVPHLELKTIHRQNADSTIIPLAHCIKNGYLPDDFMAHRADRSFIPCNSYQIGSVIKQIVTLAKSKNFSEDDVQVLAPMYRGNAGIDRLNEIIQKIMNPKTVPDQVEVQSGAFTYRIGDKVLQLVNSPENDIFNGDIGHITSIQLDPKHRPSLDKITVTFDQAEVTYPRGQWNQITLAYCTSIHKAQGSEFKMVILPMVPQYMVMLKRNLLYTAVTRASKILVLIGDYRSFQRCVKNQSANRRTSLTARLRSVSHKPKRPQRAANSISRPGRQHHILSLNLIDSGQIDPMIGMKGITPQQFMKHHN